MDAIPLSALLQGLELRPFLAPEELEAAGAFYLLDGYIRNALDEYQVGREVVLLVELDQPATAQRQYRIALKWSHLRDKIIELVRRTGGPVGPCILTGKRLDELHGVWNLCGVSPDGEIFDPLYLIPEHPAPVHDAGTFHFS